MWMVFGHCREYLYIIVHTRQVQVRVMVSVRINKCKGVWVPADPTHSCRGPVALKAPVSSRAWWIPPLAMHGNRLLDEEEHCPLDARRQLLQLVHQQQSTHRMRVAIYMASHKVRSANLGSVGVPMSLPFTLQSTSTKSPSLFFTGFPLRFCFRVTGSTVVTLVVLSTTLKFWQRCRPIRKPFPPSSGLSLNRYATVAWHITLLMCDLWCAENDFLSTPSSGHILANVRATRPNHHFSSDMHHRILVVWGRPHLS